MKHHAISALTLGITLAVTACMRPAPAAVLLYAGPGTSTNDVAAVKTILKGRQLDFATVSARQLNRMNVSQLMAYRILVVPGGNFLDIANALTPSTATNIHNAVQDGLNYLGICAGAFLAAQGQYNNLNLTSGVKFGFYSAENRGVRKAAVAITAIDQKPIEQYWEDGPELTGWGNVVGKYPDGTPAIVEGYSGEGWVVLSGVHPEAPERWRRGMTFTMPASVANAYAGTLVDAALHRTALPHY